MNKSSGLRIALYASTLLTLPAAKTAAVSNMSSPGVRIAVRSKKMPIKIAPRKKIEKARTNSRFAYDSGLYMMPEFGSDIKKIYRKIVFSGYPARLNQLSLAYGKIESTAKIPFPRLELATSTDLYGGSFGSRSLQPVVNGGGKNPCAFRTGVRIRSDLEGLVTAVPRKLATEALLDAASRVKWLEFCADSLKAVCAYLSAKRRLTISNEQVAAFDKENQQTQARYKVGSVSALSAMQFEERLNTAKTKQSESIAELNSAKKAILQLTDALDDSDFDKLDTVARKNTQISLYKLDAPTELEIQNSPIARESAAKIQVTKTDLSPIGPLFPDIEASYEFPEDGKDPNFVAEGPIKARPLVKLGASWAIGPSEVFSAAANRVKLSRDQVEHEQTRRRHQIALKFTLEKLTVSMSICDLLNNKVASTKKRIEEHSNTDQTDPEKWYETRAKCLEDYYKARIDFEASIAKMLEVHVEHMRDTGNLIQDLTPHIQAYEKEQRTKKYEARNAAIFAQREAKKQLRVKAAMDARIKTEALKAKSVKGRDKVASPAKPSAPKVPHKTHSHFRVTVRK